MQFVKEFVPDVLSSNFPQPYLITPKAGSRALTYASEDYHVACHYSTRGSEYGFIKEFESTIGAIVGYMDFGIENRIVLLWKMLMKYHYIREIAA